MALTRRSVPAGSAPLRLTGSQRGPRPDSLPARAASSRVWGGRASIPGPAGPRGHCRCRPHLPFQPEAARAPPVTQAEAAPPPAPPRSSRRSPGASLYLRVSQPQNGAEGGNQAPSPAPPRPSAPRPERSAATPPVAHSPETRLSGTASVTAPGRSGEGRPAGPLGASGRGRAAAASRCTETGLRVPRLPRGGSASSARSGREAAGEEGGPARSEVTREASRDGGRCRTRSAGPPAVAARPGRRNPGRQLGIGCRERAAPHRMLPHAVVRTRRRHPRAEVSLDLRRGGVRQPLPRPLYGSGLGSRSGAAAWGPP